MKYCTRCGTELVDEAVVCTKCGCEAGSTGQVVAGAPEITPKFIIGLVALVLGVLGITYSGGVFSSLIGVPPFYWFWGLIDGYLKVSYEHNIAEYVVLRIISVTVAVVGLVILLRSKQPAHTKTAK